MNTQIHKVLCCGGRDFDNYQFISAHLEELQKLLGTFAVIQGGAKGADLLCGVWAKAKGFPVIKVEANWDFYGKSAGHIRNNWMLTVCEPTYVVAFPGGAGTANMVAQVKQLKHITLWEITT